MVSFFMISTPKSPRDFVWQNRILILESYPGDSIWFDSDLQTGLQERKLHIFLLDGPKLAKSTFKAEIDTPKFLELLKPKSKSKLKWVLIGLDGGVKNTGLENPTPSQIFRIIDAMPMRQSEINR
ncbi:MAG: DUF4174 domain-containing protein [Algoriphagus sp.]|nr:DUF4174 domain-containing protein [Algoriphagus sp.]